MRCSVWLLGLLIFAASCGGGREGDDDVEVDAPVDDGTIAAGGLVLVPASSIFGATTLTAGARSWSQTQIVVTDGASFCDSVPSGCGTTTVPGDRIELDIDLIVETPSPGTFAIATFDDGTTPQSARIASLTLRRVGGDGLTLAADSGRVAVSRFDDDAVEGTFTVMLDSATSLEGSFAAARCQSYQDPLGCSAAR